MTKKAIEQFCERDCKTCRHRCRAWQNGYNAKQEKMWIPVSERLPETEYDTVLVFLESNIYDIAIWHSKHWFRPWYAAYFDEATPEWESKVLAWMPLPESYKGGKN